MKKTNPVFLLYISIAPLDVMNTSPGRNSNIPTENQCTLSSHQYGKKCIAGGCRSNYDISKATYPFVKEKNKEKNLDSREIQVCGFPSEHKFPEERKSLIRAIPFIPEDIINSYKTPPVICVKHLPVGFEKIKGSKGRERPRVPPSIFECVKKV